MGVTEREIFKLTSAATDESAVRPGSCQALHYTPHKHQNNRNIFTGRRATVLATPRDTHAVPTHKQTNSCLRPGNVWERAGCCCCRCYGC